MKSLSFAALSAAGETAFQTPFKTVLNARD